LSVFGFRKKQKWELCLLSLLRLLFLVFEKNF
jgi:hypothetical protein